MSSLPFARYLLLSEPFHISEKAPYPPRSQPPFVAAFSPPYALPLTPLHGGTHNASAVASSLPRVRLTPVSRKTDAVLKLDGPRVQPWRRVAPRFQALDQRDLGPLRTLRCGAGAGPVPVPDALPVSKGRSCFTKGTADPHDEKTCA